MCLAIPGKLIEIAHDANGVRMGKANFGGIVKQVCLEYTPEVETGDYVLVHVGFALSKVNEEEAARTYQLLEEMKQLGELDTPDVDPWPHRRDKQRMKYLDEYRDEALATKIVDEIRRIVTKPWVLMEVCGGQTHTIVKYGIDRLLPDEIELVHGPGCPVCVTSLEMIDKAHAIAQRPDVIFCSFGDMLRVPGFERRSFDAEIARRRYPRGLFADRLSENRAGESGQESRLLRHRFRNDRAGQRDVGFSGEETRNQEFLDPRFACPGAAVDRIHPAIAAQSRAGFSRARHVCTVMGYREYEPIAERFKVPIVITGFEPIDILEGVLMTVRQLEAGTHEVENQYPRVVDRDGNRVAQDLVNKVFEVCDRKWRGVGSIPKSGYKLRYEFRDHDAERIFDVKEIDTQEPEICISGLVLKA